MKRLNFVSVIAVVLGITLLGYSQTAPGLAQSRPAVPATPNSARVEAALQGAPVMLIKNVGQFPKGAHLASLSPAEASDLLYTTFSTSSPSGGICSYFDDFSSYATGQFPQGWSQYGSVQIQPVIEEIGGNGSAYRLFSFPQPSGNYLGKRVIKDGLSCSEVSLTTKINLQSSGDEAGIVVSFQDADNHIDITVNPVWEELVIWRWVNGQMQAVAGTGHGGLVVNTGTDYWLRAVTHADGSLGAYWSTNGSDFTLVVTVNSLGNLTGGVGYTTNGYRPPHVHFDDFTVSPPSVTCPLNQWRGEYFANRDLQGSPTFVGCDNKIDFLWGWGQDSPAPGIPADNFSVRWTRNVDFPEAGWYRFRTFTDDGLRLYVDGQRIIDDWNPRTYAERSALIELTQGSHQIKMEFVEWARDAIAHLTWYKCANGRDDCSVSMKIDNPSATLFSTMSITPTYQTQYEYLSAPMPTGCRIAPNQTIAAWGCAITSVGMALQKLNVYTTTGALNDWLSAHYGYKESDGCTAVLRWGKIEEFARNVKFKSLQGQPLSEAIRVLREQKVPVIMMANGGAHYVLAVDVYKKGTSPTDPASNEQYEQLGINDPHHAWTCQVVAASQPPTSTIQCTPSTRESGSLKHVTTRLQELTDRRPATFSLEPFGYYTKTTGSRTASLQFSAQGAEILLTDGQGRRVGYDPIAGQILLEIPNSVYFNSSIVPPGEEPSGILQRTLWLPEEAGGNYTLQVIGVSASASSFEIGIAGFDSQFTLTENMVSGTVSPGQTAEYQVIFDPGRDLRITPTPTPGPLPDKFLFAIGAQAPVGQFNSAGGVAIAPDGTVYVADIENYRIQHFTSSGTFLGTWGFAGNGDGQFNDPMGVTVASNGTVYVADTGNHRIQHFSATGQFLGKWGSYGTGDGQLSFPCGMVVAPDDTIYVADTNNHRIQRFTATGQFLAKWGSYGTGDGQFYGPSELAFDGSGNLYVADRYNNRVQKFSASGSFITKWGSAGTGNGQFREVCGVAVDALGNVYATDFWSGRVQKFTSTGTFLAQWGSGQLALPAGIATDQAGNVYVGEGWGHRVQKFTSQGDFILRWGSHGEGDGQFNEPNAVAVDTAGNVYVADTWNHRVQKFSPIGEFLRQWSRGFYTPRGLAVDAIGNVYVADSGNHRVQKFAPDGTFLLEWGTQGSGDGQFNGPWGIVVAPDSTIYVADSGNNRIQRFNAAGQFLGKWGSQGIGDGQFNQPNGVAVASDGTVYVADQFNARIQRFSATGQFLGSWGSFGNGDGQFNQPTGVAMATDGTVYVADWNNHRMQRFSATGQFLGKWGLLGSSDGQFNQPMGVAVAPDGTVYVSELCNYRIQAFGPAYPTSWRGEYFANRWLAERPVLIRSDAAINFFWHGNPPDPSVPADNFSARWQRYVWLDAGTYRFTVFTDDGVRLWVDDKLLIEAWQDPQVATYGADISLTQGYHRVRLEYYEASGSAAVQLSWGPTTQNVAVAINPASKSATVGEIFTLDVRISAGSQLVDSVDSYLSFDRNYLRVVDTNGNETNSITPGTALPVVLQNSADNSQGRITYSAGKQLGGVSPSGDFVLATIRFKAIAAIGGGGTNVNFLSGTGVFYQGSSLPIFTSNGNVQIQEAISLKGRVTLQGRGNPPDNRWNNFPLAITLYSPGGTSPVGSYTANTDASGYFTVTGITQGTYDAKVKNAHTLSNKKTNVGVPTGPTAVDFGTLLEGDANNDDNIGGADYSILATAYGKCSGQSGWDSRADFNGSGCIDGADYSLLANSYGRHGPIALAITVVGPVETEVITGSVVISIDPSSKSVPPGAILTLDIKIAAGSQVVDAVDSYLSFDRNYLRVVDASGNETSSIVSGATLSVTLQNNADNSQGRIAYSAGKQLGGVSPSGDFVLATIRFKAIAAPPGGGTAITFQSGTDAFYQGDSVLGTLANGAVSAGYRVYLPILLRQYSSW